MTTTNPKQEWTRKYREANKERLREYRKQYHIRNADNLCERSRTYYHANKDRISVECKMRRSQADYSKAIIYYIENDVNKMLYVGSTARNKDERWKEHCKTARGGVDMKSLYKDMRKLGIERFQFRVYKKVKCDSRTSLEKEEMRVVQKLLKQGIGVYNVELEQGTRNKSTAAKIRAALMRRGCLRETCDGRWTYTWRPTAGVSKTVSYGIQKYGYKKARAMAKAKQDEIFPPLDDEYRKA